MPDTPQIRIAVVDDDEDDYLIIKDYITEIEGRSFTIDWFKDYADAIEQIKAHAYHLFFVDYRLGNKTGLDLLHEKFHLGNDDPIILLTGKGSKSIDIKAMEYGATDYLVKSDLNTEKLERCIRYALERTAYLKELKTREYKYRNLFKNSKDALFIADKKLSLTEINQAAANLFGCSIEDAPMYNFYDFLKEDTEKRQIFGWLSNGMNIKDFEVQIENSSDEVISCLFSITLQEDTGGQTLLHGILHDITHIKKAEMAKLQAQKLAANDRLVRTLAHEIRNPLNNINLSIEHLQLPEDEKQVNMLGIIQRNCSRINQIITELLNLTRPLELVFEPYSLQQIMDESIEMASDRINLQKIAVEKDYPKEPLEIAADKTKLVIALTNILINATEAIKSETGKLSITVSSNGNAHTVSIRDNGCGIPQEYLTKLFEPFFTMKKNGMGLGLATAYSIVQSHKGSIDVESTLDKGTTFVLSFLKAEKNKMIEDR